MLRLTSFIRNKDRWHTMPMTDETIQQLNNINRQFYETTAHEFDQTRGQAWTGWIPLKEHLSAPLSVLDVGCGNGRFGLFLAETLSAPIAYHGIDNNAQLLSYAQKSLDPLEHLQAKIEAYDIINEPLPEQKYDLVVLFGVIHHIPSLENRHKFIQALAQRVNEGGLLVFAAWRFYEYERFRKRLVAWDEALSVEENDYLLDWRRGERALRYCHYVDDAELDNLVATSQMTELARYRADGRDDNMNVYSVLRNISE